MTLLCVLPFQKYIFCRGDFGSTIALDLQRFSYIRLNT